MCCIVNSLHRFNTVRVLFSTVAGWWLTFILSPTSSTNLGISINRVELHTRGEICARPSPHMIGHRRPVRIQAWIWFSGTYYSLFKPYRMSATSRKCKLSKVRGQMVQPGFAVLPVLRDSYICNGFIPRTQWWKFFLPTSTTILEYNSPHRAH